VVPIRSNTAESWKVRRQSYLQAGNGRQEDGADRFFTCSYSRLDKIALSFPKYLPRILGPMFCYHQVYFNSSWYVTLIELPEYADYLWCWLISSSTAVDFGAPSFRLQNHASIDPAGWEWGWLGMTRAKEKECLVGNFCARKWEHRLCSGRNVWLEDTVL